MLFLSANTGYMENGTPFLVEQTDVDHGGTCHTSCCTKCISCTGFVFFSLPFPHLHHQYDGVESDHGQDGVLKRGRYHKMPQTILESVPILGHVTGQRFGTDGKIYAGPLKYKEEKKKRKMNETVKTTACSLTIHL